MNPRVSVVIPAHLEGERIGTCLDRIFEAVTLPTEVVVVWDAPEDPTAAAVGAYPVGEPRLRGICNHPQRGPAAAIRRGIQEARADVVVVTMADGSDDPQQIDPLARLVERGVVIAAASRYMRGGQQVGGPRLKGWMSRLAGVSLHLVGRVGTHDATNSFKAYRRAFLLEAQVESDAGFEMGLEMVAKARRLRRPVAELPTIWLDRAGGQSHFQVRAWIPRYLHWYWYALRPVRSPRRRSRRGRP
ncbi:MAG TPA: glycosyltransferase family 2 protein [Verrucomicrobiae bacterium]|nr:glycosyltransferase family 2 protein [Verrucomicrobiae bacterium]